MGVLDDAVAIFACFARRAGDRASLSSKVETWPPGRRRIEPGRAPSLLVCSNMITRLRLYAPGMRLFELGQIFRLRHHFLDMVYQRVKQVCGRRHGRLATSRFSTVPT